MIKKIMYSGFTITLFLFLLFYPISAVNAAKQGLQLWFYTVLPTLLPFIILSTIIRKMQLVRLITVLFSPITKRLLHISDNSTYVMLIGFLCGYPMGAKMTGDFVRDGELSVEEGQYMLLFTNNVSPIFVISFLAKDSLHCSELLPFLLGVIYGVPLLTAFVLNPFNRCKCKTIDLIHKGKLKEKASFSWNVIDESIENGLVTITKLGGYMILFAIITCMLSLLPVSGWCKLVINSLCEITWGIGSVSAAEITLSQKLLLLLPAVCFGGISCIAQTNSMIQGTQLSIRKYILAKAMQFVLAAGIVILHFTLLYHFH